MLETSSLATLNFETPLTHAASVGPFHQDMRAEIRDDDGRALPTNETGELWVAGPNIMKGSYRNPDATGEVLHDGWLKTGDLGFIDADGHLYLCGRSKELVIVSGHNVYPREVENVLLEHAHVSDAAVAAEMDPIRGERLVGFVVAADAQTIDDQELIQHCRDRLSPYKVPRAIHVVASIPRNAAGKIVRRQLTEGLTASRLQERTAEAAL
jgi:acyl-CoA synthetase (AMP-forming)/AMP-acid ligase II